MKAPIVNPYILTFLRELKGNVYISKFSIGDGKLFINNAGNSFERFLHENFKYIKDVSEVKVTVHTLEGHTKVFTFKN